jgi:ABC-type uncharacterized transport system permease subunit
MLQLTHILEIVLPLLYAGLVWIFAEIFFRSGDTGKRMKRALPGVIIVIVVHVSYVGLYAMSHGHDLVATSSELASLIAFTLITIYAFVESRLKSEASGTGFLVAAVAFVFQLLSSLFINETANAELAPIFKNPIFNVHVTTAVFGYAALSLAMIYGALYLLLFRAMRQNRYGAVFQNLPSLEKLERYGIRATAAGFFCLTISITLGALLLKNFPVAGGTSSYFLDPKILATLLVWAVFGATLVVRRFARIEGRRLVLFWMYGFVLTIVSMTVVNALGTSFHNFL